MFSSVFMELTSSFSALNILHFIIYFYNSIIATSNNRVTGTWASPTPKRAGIVTVCPYSLPTLKDTLC
jgi:hypothetical protein